MTEETKTGTAAPSLEDWQHWTWVMGRAQQMLMESWADGLKSAPPAAAASAAPGWGAFPPAFGATGSPADPMAMMTAGAEAWAKGLDAWGKMIGLEPSGQAEAKDKRFAAPEWRESPVFDQIRQTYLALSDRLLGTVEEVDGVDAETRQKMKFATRSFVDAMSPSNFALTNPQVLK